MLAGVMNHRVAMAIECRLDPRRNAYRRGRGPEMALAEVIDFAHRALNRSQFVCAASFDVAGAFGSVPHHRLMGAMGTFGLRGELSRFDLGHMGGCTLVVSSQ